MYAHKTPANYTQITGTGERTILSWPSDIRILTNGDTYLVICFSTDSRRTWLYFTIPHFASVTLGTDTQQT